MKTDELIAAIAADSAAPLPSVKGRMAAALAAGGAVAGAWFVYSLGVRPDVASAVLTWRFVTKLLIVAACVVSALWASLRLARPEAERSGTLAILSVPPALLAIAVVAELALSPADGWAARAIGSNSRICLVSVALMAVAPLAALLMGLRAGAPRSAAAAGAVAGLLAGSLGALLYAFHCTDDSPLFVALWYSPPIALAAAAGALVGSRLLRW
jgi:hypothetical protein